MLPKVYRRAVLLAAGIIPVLYLLPSPAPACTNVPQDLEQIVKQPADITGHYEIPVNLQVGQKFTLKLPLVGTDDKWLGQIAWAHSLKTGTPKNPRVKLTYLEESNTDKARRMNGLILEALSEADLVLPLFYEPGSSGAGSPEHSYGSLRVKVTDQVDRCK